MGRIRGELTDVVPDRATNGDEPGGLGEILEANPVEGAVGCLDQLGAGVGCVVYGAGIVLALVTTVLVVASGDLATAQNLVRAAVRELGLAIVLCVGAWAAGLLGRRWRARRRRSQRST